MSVHDDVAAVLGEAVLLNGTTTPQAQSLGDAVGAHLSSRPMSAPRVFMRAFPAQLEQTDDQTLTGRLVPYGVVADVLDEVEGRYDIYREGFQRGAFDGQVLTGARNKGVLTKIGLIHRHDGGLGYLGPFTALRERDDGLWGDVTILPTKAPDVAALLRAGVDELSIEFRLRKEPNTMVDDHGVRWRTSVHLDQVALEPKGAYRGAQVLAMRAEQDELDRQRAEEAAAAEAERQTADAERDEAEAAAAAAVERKRAWDEMQARLADDEAKQRQYVTDYGLTKPPGFGSV